MLPLFNCIAKSFQHNTREKKVNERARDERERGEISKKLKISFSDIDHGRCICGCQIDVYHILFTQESKVDSCSVWLSLVLHISYKHSNHSYAVIRAVTYLQSPCQKLHEQPRKQVYYRISCVVHTGTIGLAGTHSSKRLFIWLIPVECFTSINRFILGYKHLLQFASRGYSTPVAAGGLRLCAHKSKMSI